MFLCILEDLFSLYSRCCGWGSRGAAVPARRRPGFAGADESPGLVPPGPGLQRVSGPVEPDRARRPGPGPLAPLEAEPTAGSGGQSGAGADPGRLDPGRGMGSPELGEERGGPGWREEPRRPVSLRGRFHRLVQLRAGRLPAGARRRALHAGAVQIASARASGRLPAAAGAFPRPPRLQPPLAEPGLPDRTGRRSADGHGVGQAQKGRGPPDGVPSSGAAAVGVHGGGECPAPPGGVSGFCRVGRLVGNRPVAAPSYHAALQPRRKPQGR